MSNVSLGSSVLKNVLSRSEEFTSSVNFEADFSKRFDGGLGEFMPDKMEEMKDGGEGASDYGDNPVDITDEDASDVKLDELARSDAEAAADESAKKKKNMKEEMFEIQNM